MRNPNNDDISVQIFDIIPDGCLNGRFINLQTGEVYNEIARKLWPDTDGLDGIYNNSYIDSDGTWLSVLVITSLTNKKFQFEWFDKHNGNQDWTGEGWYIKQNQIALKYWK